MPSTNGHGPKRAVLYARVSTQEQAAKGYSLAQQLEALRSYAAREGYEVIEEVEDRGQSGASLERPGMDRVRDLVAEGSISVVLAQDRDRFAREPAYHYLLRREFEEHGCKLQALNDRGDNSPEGELTNGILDQLAKFERAKTAERSRRGKLRKAREGKIVASASVDYGFMYSAIRDSYEVNEANMPTVRRIFRMVGSEGYSLGKVKQRFEAEGLPTPAGKKYWSKTFIREVIKDDVYRPHSLEEIKALVTPEVAAQLEPDRNYGIWWFNRKRHTSKQVVVHTSEGSVYPQKEEVCFQAAKRVDRRACAGRRHTPRVGGCCQGSHQR
jgi:site-specific DNA recombinase